MADEPSAETAGLSRVQVVEASLDLARRVGVDSLTMRAVAGELGVTPMALYRYVASKDELLDLVIDAAANHERSLVLDDGPWDVALRDHLVAMWADMTQFPGLSAYLIESPMLGMTTESMSEGVRFLEAAGFPTREAQLGWSVALTWLHGRLSVDARLRTLPGAPRVAGLRARDYAIAGAETVVAGLRARLGQAPAGDGSPLPSNDS